MKKKQYYINKPTDEFVTSFDSYISDSMSCVVRCMIEASKAAITKEINDHYPDADVISNEGKFLANASNLLDVICDFDKACSVYGTDEDYKYFKKKLKEDSQFIKDIVGNRASFKAILEDMFSECQDRKELINEIIRLLY